MQSVHWYLLKRYLGGDKLTEYSHCTIRLALNLPICNRSIIKVNSFVVTTISFNLQTFCAYNEFVILINRTWWEHDMQTLYTYVCLTWMVYLWVWTNFSTRMIETDVGLEHLNFCFQCSGYCFCWLSDLSYLATRSISYQTTDWSTMLVGNTTVEKYR